MSGKKLSTFLLIVGIALILGAIAYTVLHYMESVRSEDKFASLRNGINTSQQAADSTVPSENEGEESQKPPYVSPYSNLFEQNSDMIGWLQIPGMNIDYPIMYTPEEHDYYLSRDFFGNPDKNGCLVLAAPDDMVKPSVNLLIHGHNMRSRAMFGSLREYASEEFRNSHSEIILFTQEDERRYEVVGAFNVKILKEGEKGFWYYTFFDTDEQERLESYLRVASLYNLYGEKEIKGSLYTGLFDNSYSGDQFITLSTCRGRAGGDDRFVVMGKRVK